MKLSPLHFLILIFQTYYFYARVEAKLLEIAVKIENAGKVDEIARRNGFINKGLISPSIPNHYLFVKSVNDRLNIRFLSDNSYLNRDDDGNIAWKKIQKPLKRILRNDPYYSEQWHLDKMGIKEAWTEANVTGRGILVSVVDDGVEVHHVDLKDNHYINASFDIVDNDRNPDPEGKK